ncbi:pectate lyase family protein [Halocatena salina]|uniref:Pectate lyase n=1 Tax=Halocatena salina TaxID=2934340 RepID=A0A8U0A6Z6_9EURY|nr:pectate lyase [Halocatena salina]UPM44298.1 pectate lyase [Halocatena salina]
MAGIFAGRTAAETTVTNDESGAGSHFDPTVGFADPAPWLEDDDVEVLKVSEPAREPLAAAIDRDGPRVIVFETSGTIDLEMKSLEISNNKCWIAGQTAPTPGITLVRGGLYVEADDCVVQHLRVRPGDADAEPGSGWEPDAMHTGDDTKNNVIDHCSTSWAVDETLSVGYRTEDTTVSNCIIAEGLNDATHTKGEHGYGTLVGDLATNVTLVGNVWAHNTGRNPAPKGGTTSVIANNVIYHATDWITSFGGPGPGSDVPARSVVENNAYLRIGSHFIQFGHVHYDGNYMAPGTPAAVDKRLDERPLWPAGLELLPSGAVVDHQSAYVGARPADRTYHDRRIVEDVRASTGSIIDSQAEVGGYPALDVNTRELHVPTDTLRSWLRAHAVTVEQPRAKRRARSD